MYNSKRIGQVASYKPVARCDIEELAAMQQTRPSGGMLFARNPDRKHKDIARQKILDLFTPEAHPEPISILTMPGIDWRFERKLFGKREGDWFRKTVPTNTRMTSVENDRFIYYSAVHQMPGLNTKRPLATILRPAPFAERSVKTKFVEGFHFANVDDLMAQTDDIWDAAWLDYTGPLTVERLRLISQFYARSIRKTLVITALRARENRAATEAIARRGGYWEWIRAALPGDVLHEHEYFDTSPMAQFAVTKSV